VKQTKAQDDEARHHARTHPMWAIERAAMQLCRPDLADLPDYSEPAKRKPGRPYWFRRIVWDCEAAARRRAEIAACPYDTMMMVRDMTRPILRAMRNGFRSCWRRRWRRASLFFDHDAPTLEDILEGWKLMDAERKRVFAVPLY
jgi:hypothetical protein